MERVFLIGCGGMLGSYVYEEFKEHEIKAYDIDVNDSWMEYGDITDKEFLRNAFEDFKPTLVINLAAKTDLEYCEENKELAYDTNSFSAEYLGDLCEDYGSVYIFISTAGIFDGKRENYTEYEPAYPLGVYGISKWHTENYINNKVKKSYIMRAGWMFGGGRKDKKFIRKITEQINDGKKELNVVDDKLGTPTYTKDFAKNMKNIFDKKLPYGLYNSVSKGDASRYDTVVELINILELDIKVNKVESEFFKEEYYAERPKSEKLLNAKLEMLNENNMREWKDALRDYILNGNFKEYYEV